MRVLLTLLISYLLGSIPSALIVGKIFGGIDIRNFGSGNLGATNTFRVLGVKAGSIVIVADILKGIISSYIALKVGGTTLAIIAGGIAILGHSFPILAGFRGGKGIATGAGLYLVIMPFGFITALLVFLLILFTTGYVSLASIIAALTLFVCSIIFKKGFFIILITFVLCAFVIQRHRENIKRLLNGTENKVNTRIFR